MQYVVRSTSSKYELWTLQPEDTQDSRDDATKELWEAIQDATEAKETSDDAAPADGTKDILAKDAIATATLLLLSRIRYADSIPPTVKFSATERIPLADHFLTGINVASGTATTANAQTSSFPCHVVTVASRCNRVQANRVRLLQTFCRLDEATVALERTGAVALLAGAISGILLLRQCLLVVIRNLTKVVSDVDEDGFEPLGHVHVGTASIQIRGAADRGHSDGRVVRVRGVISVLEGGRTVHEETPGVIVGVLAVVLVRAEVANHAIAVAVETGAHLVLDYGAFRALDRRQRQQRDNSSSNNQLHACSDFVVTDVEHLRTAPSKKRSAYWTTV